MNCTKDCMKERIRQVHYVPPSSGWFILLATTAGRFIGRHSNSMPDPELSPRRLPSCERFAPLIAMLHETVFGTRDRKSTRLNSSHGYISYAVFCLKKKTRLVC